MELTAGIACGISWSELGKAWNLQGWSTKKPDSLGCPFFGLGIFTHHGIILAMTFDFSRTSKTNLQP